MIVKFPSAALLLFVAFNGAALTAPQTIHRFAKANFRQYAKNDIATVGSEDDALEQSRAKDSHLGNLAPTEFKDFPLSPNRFFSNVQFVDSEGGDVIVVRKEGSLGAAVALVTGTTVGAGILALPAVSLASGALPSTVALVGCWAYMTSTGLLIAEVN